MQERLTGEELLPSKTTYGSTYDAVTRGTLFAEVRQHEPMGPSKLAAATALVLGMSMIGSAHAGNTAAAVTGSCLRANAITATFLDPYDFWDPSDERLSRTFVGMHDAGISTLIVQWNGARRADGTVATTYVPSTATGFTAWSTTLPRILREAQEHHIAVWLGLVLQSNVLDDPATRDDAHLLEEIATEDRVLAADLFRQYPGQFAGWYIPTEPGYASVSSDERRTLHTQYLASITGALRKLGRDLPVMVSPAVATAATAGRTGTWFIDRMTPMMMDAGVDVWNIQTGFKMTAWTAEDDADIVRAARDTVHGTGISIWADAYTPGPGQSNGPTNFDELHQEMEALSATGAPISTWTFDAAMNPDPARSDAAARAALYDSYRETVCSPASS